MAKHIEGPILILGFCGHKMAGKDTVAKAVRDLMFNCNGQGYATTEVIMTSFAEPIREIGKIFGFSNEQLNDQSLKEKIVPLWNMTPRKFMQLVGTEMFRNTLDKDCWIKLLQHRIFKITSRYNDGDGRDVLFNGVKYRVPAVVICITDVRFENEAAMIRKMGGYIVRVKRELADTAPVNHASEKEIDNILPDFTIENAVDDLEWFRRVAANEMGKFFTEIGVAIAVDRPMSESPAHPE